MDRIGTDDGLFTEGSSATGTKGTKVTSAWLNLIQEEVVNAILAFGLSLDAEKDDQLASILTAQCNLPGYIDGLILSNGADSEHDIDVSDGFATFIDGSGNYRGFRCSDVPTKQLDAVWAEGNNAGGFPSALTLGAAAYLHYFLIGKSDGTIDAGFDTDDAAANLLSEADGYSWYRRILGVCLDASNNIRPFNQNGDHVTYLSPPTDVADTTLTKLSFESGALSVAPNSIAIVSGEGRVDDTSNVYIYIRPGDISSSALAPISVVDGEDGTTEDYVTGGQGHIPVGSSRSVEYACDGVGTAFSLYIKTIGWIDSRGRNAA